jgi:hypothetical protein
MDGNTQVRPAEFGDWSTGAGLNPVYDDARPDIVLVTMGADDIKFAEIVKACVIDSLRPSHPHGEECTSANPGDVVQRDYVSELPDLAQHYALLAAWIEARGKAAHPAHVPRVVFTNYYNPLPQGVGCQDTFPLDPAQIQYLSGLQDGLTNRIQSEVQSVMGQDPNVGFADFSTAMDKHRWCSSDPWAYGLSILLDHIGNPLSSSSSLNDQSPFHPTPVGQFALAQRAEPAVRALLPGKG